MHKTSFCFECWGGKRERKVYVRAATEGLQKVGAAVPSTAPSAEGGHASSRFILFLPQGPWEYSTLGGTEDQDVRPFGL